MSNTHYDLSSNKIIIKVGDISKDLSIILANPDLYYFINF
jgi:hypothetical protein